MASGWTSIVDLVDSGQDVSDALDSAFTALDGDVASLGGTSTALATKTASYLMLTTDSIVLGDATAGDITITLPSPASCYNATDLTSLVFSISKIDVSGNKVTIAPSVAETIAGDASFDLLYVNEALELITDGTNWYIKG